MGFINDFSIIDEANKNRTTDIPGMTNPLDEFRELLKAASNISMPPPAGTFDDRAAGAVNPYKISPLKVAQDAMAANQQPAGKTDEEYIAPYLQKFTDMLKPPEYDKNRARRLQTASLINALGNVMTNMVNAKYAPQGAPVIPTSNKNVILPLEEERRMREIQQGREDQFQRMNMSALMNATQYGREDKRFDESTRRYEQSRQDRKNETAEERAWREGFADKQFGQSKELHKMDFDQRIQAYEEQHNYQMKEIAERNRLEWDNVMKKAGIDSAQKAYERYTKDSFPVTDVDGKSVNLPPEIYWDVVTRSLDNMNKDFSEFVTSQDFNATNNAANAMVTKYWKDFYEPVYDQQGNHTGFKAKGGGAAATPSLWPGQAQPEAGAQEDGPEFWN